MQTLEISGVRCQNCVNKITSTLGEEFGPISFNDTLSQVTFNGDVDEFIDALADLGFAAK